MITKHAQTVIVSSRIQHHRNDEDQITAIDNTSTAQKLALQIKQIQNNVNQLVGSCFNLLLQRSTGQEQKQSDNSCHWRKKQHVPLSRAN